MATSKSSHLLVAAFDFGTTYSGYAFSWRNDPLKVQTNQNWTAGSEKLISLKTPTCVLLGPDKQFHSFGYEAENKYADLADDNKHHGWLFFRRFKMLLHNNENLSRYTTVDDINGNQMNAMTIFSMSIRYLREHLLATLNKQTTGVDETDILYVITVPAIWNDSAKQFMRETCIKAGIDTSRLKFALEPEAASIWCQLVTDEDKVLTRTGTKYMVVDLGGGTADITVHEKLSDGTLKELHKASGGPWGGMYVDSNYLQWLENLFGKTAMERFKKEEMVDYFDILREFETKKRAVKSDSNDQIIFRIAVSLREKSEENLVDGMIIEERLESLNLEEKVTIRRDKMKVDADIVKDWFRDPVENVVRHVQQILDEPNMRNVNTILLVGGFGESQYVHEKFQKAFSNKHLIVPPEAGLAVLKGAVKFGHEPFAVSARVMQYTYGIEATGTFNKDIHPASKMLVINGEKLVTNKFLVFVTAGQTISLGSEVSKRLTPIRMNESRNSIYCSTSQDPLFTTDPSCKLLGVLVVEHPEGKTLEEKTTEVTFVFGETELLVKARILKTGREFYTTIDCLKN